MIYPEPEKGGRGKKSKNSTETLGFSAMRLSQARTVLSHSRDVAMEISVLNRYRAYVLRIQYGQPYMSFVPVRRSHASHLAVSFGVTSTISPSSSSGSSYGSPSSWKARQHRGEIGDQEVRSRGVELPLPEDEKDAPPRGG